jgi:hypothetical protein
MLFEVFNKRGKRVMYTEFKDCMPPKEQIANMINSEYKVCIDKKPLTKKALSNLKYKED